MIIGRDLIRILGIDIMYSKGRLVWDNISIPMKTAPVVHEAFKKAWAGNSEELERLEEIYRMHEETLDII